MKKWWYEWFNFILSPVTLGFVFPCLVQAQLPINISLEILDKDSKKQIEEIARKPLIEQIKEIKNLFDVELLSTTRRAAKTYFDTLGPAKRSVEQVTDVEGLYGKAVCPGVSDTKAKILIAKDAPPSTLLHEYIHVLQMKKEKRWCELDGRVLESQEKRERALLYHRFEFEVLKTIWDFKDKIDLTTEDRLILVEGLNRENKVFSSIGIKALDDQTGELLAKEFDEAQLQVTFFSWLAQSHQDAGSVLQKMEILTLKSCVESTEGTDVAGKINKCIEKRCGFAGLSCQKIVSSELKKFNDDLLSEVIYAWTKPNTNPDCTIAKLKDELTSAPENSSQCWKSWYEKHEKSGKDVSLSSMNASVLAQKYGVPDLSIDKKIQFFEATNPESFINAAYCYFIFQKVIKFDSLPIDQFSYASLGASLSRDRLPQYRRWLTSDSKGKMCAKVVKLFSGEDPEPWNDESSKKYILIINQLGALTGGLQDLTENIAVDINHERLHAFFSDDLSIQNKMRLEWAGLGATKQDNFRKSHPSYDFTDEQVLLKEYFSFSRQKNPQKLF